MIKTAITDLYGIKYPIICGAMMWLGKPDLTAAVSNAGGMGTLTAAIYPTPEEWRAAIRETNKLTDKPFLAGITFLPAFNTTVDHFKPYVKACIEGGVAGIEVSGQPMDTAIGQQYVDMLKDAGVKLFHKVGSVRHAVHCQKVGYDGVYAAGFEEGGHPLSDDVTTMTLTPRIREEIDLPIVTVGGISNGRSLAAALSLGGDGVMMATRFMATKECKIHARIKQELRDRQERDTTLVCKTLHLQARALRNKTIEKVLEMEERGTDLFELMPLITGKNALEAWQTGDVDVGMMTVGQSIGLIHDEPTMAELMERMVVEARERLAWAQYALNSPEPAGEAKSLQEKESIDEQAPADAEEETTPAKAEPEPLTEPVPTMSLEEATQGITGIVGNDCGIPRIVKLDLGQAGVIIIDGNATPNTVSNENQDSDITAKLSLANLGLILGGSLSSQTAFMNGDMAIEGDMAIALKVAGLLG